MHEATDHTTPVRFYAIGDTSPAVMQTLRLLTHNDPATTELTVHLGDIQYYSALIESQQLWFSLMEPILRANAFMPCVGNHEDEQPHEFDDIYARLFATPGRDGTTRWYHYESGGVHFISFSTEDDLALGSEQHDWFEATMDRIETEPGYRFTVVYFHRPIYTVASYSPRLDDRAAIEAVTTTHQVPLGGSIIQAAAFDETGIMQDNFEIAVPPRPGPRGPELRGPDAPDARGDRASPRMAHCRP